MAGGVIQVPANSRTTASVSRWACARRVAPTGVNGIKASMLPLMSAEQVEN